MNEAIHWNLFFGPELWNEERMKTGTINLTELLDLQILTLVL